MSPRRKSGPQKKKDDHVKSALQLAWLLWPCRGATANPIFTLLSLTRNWGVAFLIRLYKDSKRRCVIQPTDRYHDLVLIWEKAHQHALHESLFNELRARYGTSGAALVHYDMQAYLENKTLLALRESFRDVDAPDLELDGSTVWQSIVDRDAASVNHETWRIALAELFGICQDPDVQVVIRNPGFVKQVSHLPSLLSDEGFALWVGWMMVQLLSLFSNQEVVVHTTMAFALTADYVNQVAMRATVNDVAVIVRRVSQHIREQVRLSPDIEDIMVPSYDNETGAVFRYLEKSTDAHHSREFSAFTNMSPVLLKSLYILSRGFTQATWRACHVAQANHGLEHLENFPDMSGGRLFFFAWCYLKCDDAFGEYACNVPLSHSLAFAEAYNCTSGTPMKKEWRCVMLGNAH
ncbi:hypothetical protein HPB49_012807 [Dermacentor silvarum]|uniref:Uncharacterized protein n=1 Tax=Dermacentor silvarum TaxID=543639 RepID=A0ACB8E0B5_DERSI|nr:hypothetical protein HPB49_012807 [Dermacentor silvarum]